MQRRGIVNCLILITFILVTLYVSVRVYFLFFGEPKLVLTETQFQSLNSWSQDNHAQALMAFEQSCADLNKRDPSLPFHELKEAGKVKEWQVICQAAKQVSLADSGQARQFFETWFIPYAVSNHTNDKGLFTGYYLPLLHVKSKPSQKFYVPIYATPKDLIKIDLSSFDADLQGKKIIGHLEGNRFVPYPDRAAINQGKIRGKAPIIARSADPVDVFFAQIQGSAILKIDGKEEIIINYATDNGHRYTGIGSILIKQYGVPKDTLSMQGIRAWLSEHPDKRDALLDQDRSYVFFEVMKNKQAVGSRLIPLTPQRSLAVDLRYVPFGAPIWLETEAPSKNSNMTKPFHHLMVAQDTGGAIKGIVRGDVYWGNGEEAELIAGNMKNEGQYWILLPRKKSN